jgi:hypothetical protein
LEAELRVIFATLAWAACAILSAQAAPAIPPRASPVELGVAPSIEQVRDGCGYAYHRMFSQDGWGGWYWGRCVPNWWGEGAFLPQADESDD